MPVPESGCLIWMRAVAGSGYASLGVNGKQQLAHRAAYELAFGPIPAGLHIDHLCNVRLCMNPHHMKATTQRENTLRAVTGITGINSRKTHCIHGHAFSAENTYVPPSKPNARYCKECQKRRCREYDLSGKRP